MSINMYAATAVGMMNHDTACRVRISPVSNYVEVQCLKGITLDNTTRKHYLSLDDTPEWIRHRVYALSVLDPDAEQIVEDVGVRSTPDTFWVFKKSIGQMPE